MLVLTAVMGRVRIKHPNSTDIGVRRRLLGLLSPRVKVTRLIPTNDAVIVLTPSDKDSEAIFQDGTIASLAADGFSPLMPPELRAHRTVICSGLDELVYEHTTDEIAAEVEAQHEWPVESVFKFPRSPTVKITFTDGDMAKKALVEGLHIFHIHVPGHQLRQEQYIPLLTCNRCNAVEKHSTSSCPHPPDYVRCSECGSLEHSFRNCTATVKSCLNCAGDHSARAMRCPTRKEALRKKEAELRQARTRPGVSFAQAASASTSATPSFGAIDTTKSLAGLMCLLHAHLSNIASPGSFQQALSAGLAENGLPNIKLPPPPPVQGPEALLRALTSASSPATPSPSTASVPPTTSAPPPTAASATASAVSSDAEDSEDDDEPPRAVGLIRFGFLAKAEKKKTKHPTTKRELGQAMKSKGLVFCQTGPPEAEELVLDFVRQHLDSIPDWTVYSTEDHARAMTNPQQIVGDLLPGRFPVTRE